MRRGHAAGGGLPDSRAAGGVLAGTAPAAIPGAFHGGEHMSDVTDQDQEQDTDVGGIAADRLRSIIERVERLEEERKALADDIKDIFGEAKSAGFDLSLIHI